MDNLMIPEKRLDEDTPEIKRRQRYINKCKEAAWKRWKKEYLGSLRERRNMMDNIKEMKIEVGDVALITGEEKSKGKWNIGIVEELCKSKDDVIRSVKLRIPKSHIERPIQHLYPLELHCDIEKSTSKSKNISHKKLNVDAKEYRPQRTAAAIAEMQTRNIIAEQSDE